MRKKYIEELERLKIRMSEAEEFAEKLPIFEKQIIDNKYTGNEDFIRFGDKYKDIQLNIGRGFYKSGTSRNITNYHGKTYAKFLFCIDINFYSLFGCHNYNFNLENVVKNISVFFFDKFNSTFYATDEQIIFLLEALNDWYITAKKENSILLRDKKKKEAKKQLEEAEKQYKQIQIENEMLDLTNYDN